MKKSKILLVTVLALVLCLLCVTTSTFSWYTRPNAQSGNKLAWNSAYSISNGNGISMLTQESTDGGETYTEAVNNFSSAGLAAGECKYYRTAITNTGTSSQSVSLFLSQLDLSNNTGGKFYLGVNGPLKTYKNYSNTTVEAGTAVKSTINEKYVYLGLHASEESDGKFNNKIERIHAWNNSINLVSKSYWDDRYVTGKTGTWKIDGKWNDQQQTFNIYAMKIDYRCTDFQLKGAGDENSGWYNDAKPSIVSNNTIVFYEYGDNYTAEAKTSGTAAGLESFYSSASVGVGDTINLKATGQGALSYESSNTGVATVSSSGVVRGVKAGTTTITVTSTGAYGETIKANCTVRVIGNNSNAGFDVPIVTNYSIAASDDPEDPTVRYVYWYIKNESESSSLKYNISEIYLSL
ncbi:MAG: Ig-like domain-containing protein [Ruminococcus sp.]|nr:Ig-like domain-containing protein [Ruminococcus sp.]